MCYNPDMGIKQILIDDLDGSELPDDTTPVSVTFDGKKYDVYMSSRNTERFVDFLNGGVPLLGFQRVTRTRAGRTVTTLETYGATAKQVREWALAKGHTIDGKSINERGRVTQAWFDAYNDSK